MYGYSYFRSVNELPQLESMWGEIKFRDDSSVLSNLSKTEWD